MDYSSQDIQLMLRFKNGEESCFEKLVELHKNRVFRLAYRFLGNYQDAQDAAQEIFIKVYRARAGYSPRAKFTTWLYAICKNTCLKKLLKKKLSTVSVSENIELDENTVTRQIADTHTPTPEESTLNNEKVLIIKQAIDSLPENQKMAVILYRYEQLSYDEISEIMGLSAKAVKSLLHRARGNLKGLLADYFRK